MPVRREGELRRLHAQGLSGVKIAGLMGVSPVMVTTWLRMLNLPPRGSGGRRGRESPPGAPGELRRLYDLGLSQREIAARLKVPRLTVHEWLHRIGANERGSNRPRWRLALVEEELRRRVAAGESVTLIAAGLHTCQESVRRWLLHLGLTAKRGRVGRPRKSR